ncbi:MAG: RagB/SusD family nutrient uptake outer membrane protein, partial [Bacteroidales bacterium]|nr:RagB/SusD family nutrient uptake outer membrane protein [Bacteroidales bacterium]
MKKTISIFAIFAAALAAVSCDSYFNVNLSDQATLESLYSKRVSVRNFVSNMYTYLPREEHVDASEGMGVLRSDESLFGASQHTSIAYKLRWGDYGSATVDGDSNGTFWDRYYQAINQCTIFLQNIDRNQDDAPEYVTYMKAEATVMRAYYYYCLFRHYGPVIIWGEEQASMDTDGSTLDRNTLEENISFMLGQIEKALPDLPLRIEEVPTLSDEKDRGRVTKGFALALKMRILLLQASPLFNGNPLYASMTNKEGKKIFPESRDLSKWDLVAKAAQDVLDLGVYELVQPKGTTMQDYADAYQSVFFENWNSEIIWGWWFRTWAPSDPYAGTVGGLLAASVPMQIASAAGLTTKAPLYGWQLFTPSLKLVDAFPMMASGRYPVTGYDRDSKGLNYSKPHVDPVSGYVAEGWEDNYTQPVDVPWAAPFKAHKSTVGRDPRFYSNFVPNGFWWPDQSLKCRVTDFSREQGKSYTAAEMKDPEVYATNQ